jgi:hypothetical protein
MKYVLLFGETEEWERAWEALDRAGRERAYSAVGRWMATNAGEITRRRPAPRSVRPCWAPHTRGVRRPEACLRHALAGGRGPLKRGRHSRRPWCLHPVPDAISGG